MITRISAMASTGTASRKMKLVAYIVQTKIGSRNQVRPGARSQWTVTMKFRPVKIDEKPAITTPIIVRHDVVVRRLRAVGRVEGPAGIDAAGEHGVQASSRRRSCTDTSSAG